MNIQGRMAEFAQRFGPIIATVAAALLIILGIVMIAYPPLLAWIVGIALVLAGVALVAAVFTPGTVSSSVSGRQ